MSCVLCQNTSGTVTLLDIARSIAEGSGVDQVVSSPGRTRPYPTTEPKGSKQAELQATIPQDQHVYDRKIEKLLADALEQVRNVRGQKAWYIDRADAVPSAHDHSHLPEQGHPDSTSGIAKPPVVLSALENHFPSITCLEDTVVFNPNDKVVGLRIPGRNFQISPRCTFLLASLDHEMHHFCRIDTPGSPLDRADHQLAMTSAGDFDLILLDPPWPNRSARRAKVYHSYSERQQGGDPFHQALRVVDKHLKNSGIAAIWITNKRAIRTLVFETMHSLGLELFQEWIWLKTTIYGEPVTPLDGLWRKPYEILLLFRRTRDEPTTCSIGSFALEDEAVNHPNITQPQGATQDAGNMLQEYPDVQTRMLIAVPDAHSRKPCLKELLKSLLPDDYRALEIFARNLTAGWWSWGDEVLKFNEVLPKTMEAMPE